MSYAVHMKGYNDPRALYQINRLYAWSHGEYFPPAIVEISPSGYCNQKCKYCYAHNRVEGVLRESAFVNVMRQLKVAGVDAVLLQGTGEPLINKGLAEAVIAGSKIGLEIGLTTNTVLFTPEIQERTLEHLQHVRFSVLDIDEKRYAAGHGCPPEHLRHVIQNIEFAVKYRTKHNLRVGFWGTVFLTRETQDSIYEIISFYKGIGIDYIALAEAEYNQYAIVKGSERFASPHIDPAKIEKICCEAKSLIDEDFFVKVRLFVHNTKYSGFLPENWTRNYCQGIRFHTTIASDGEVYPCWRVWGHKEYSYGSIYENSFEQIWKSERRRDIISYINETPPQGTECTVCQLAQQNENLNKLTHATVWRHFL